MCIARTAPSLYEQTCWPHGTGPWGRRIRPWHTHTHTHTHTHIYIYMYIYIYIHLHVYKSTSVSIHKYVITCWPHGTGPWGRRIRPLRGGRTWAPWSPTVSCARAARLAARGSCQPRRQENETQGSRVCVRNGQFKVPCAPKWFDLEFPILKTTKLGVGVNPNAEQFVGLANREVRRETGHTHKHTIRTTPHNTRHAKNNTTHDHTRNPPPPNPTFQPKRKETKGSCVRHKLISGL